MRTSFRPAPLSEFAKVFQNLQKKQAPAALHFVFSGKKYTIQRRYMLYGELGVAVPKEVKYVVSCPANTFEATEHVSRAKATLPATNNGEAVSPLIFNPRVLAYFFDNL